VLDENGAIGAMGLALGLLAALALGRTVSGFLFGVASWDPVTYGVVTALVVGVIAAASLVPIRRVTRVVPADVLRDE
jgi:ABC-type antimicrobial peptide transport system permease subunit